MVFRSQCARFGLLTALILSLVSTALPAGRALADTDLVLGQPARIAHTGGDQIRLRQSADANADILRLLDEATIVQILDSPITDAAGVIWYHIQIDDLSGYVMADYLALASDEAAPAEDVLQTDSTTPTAAASIPTAVATRSGVITGTNGEGAKCRNAANLDAALIVLLLEGQTVQLTGDAVDSWQPVNCADQGGFVSAQFVVPIETPAETATEVASAPVETATDETPIDIPTEVVTETTTEVPAESPTDVATEVPTETSTAEATEVSTEIETEAATETASSTPEATETPAATETETEMPSATSTPTSTATTEPTGTPVPTEIITGPTVDSGTATVTGTKQSGLRCRSAASSLASIIMVLNEGDAVTLRPGSTVSWQAVTCGGVDGFVRSGFLSVDIASPTPQATSVVALPSSGNAIVGGTNGDGLRCRSAGSYTSRVLSILTEGASITITGAATGGWQPVLCGTQPGFVLARYLVAGESSTMENGISSAEVTTFAVAGTATVTGTGGMGVRLRSGPSSTASIILVVPEGATVALRSGSSGVWTAATYKGYDGFIHQDYLTTSTSTGGTGTPNTSGELVKYDHALVTTSLNLRYEPSMSAGIAAVAPSGTVVKIRGSASNGFYPVNWDGLRGWMYGTYLTKTSAALTQRGGSGTPAPSPTPTPAPGGGGGTATGSAMVNYAMQYLGYPYVWATHGPSSFDCSGFTYWVTKNVLGRDIGAGLWTQVSAGSPVSQANLQPGDLVFFQNTYTWGLSHVGIYIGNGQFIHAQNESTGVVISNLSSTYYASRWYGATRLA